MLAGGVDPWIYHNVAGIRPPSTRSLQGVRGSIADVVHLGVPASVVIGVQSCSGAVAVPGGGAVELTWQWNDTALDMTPTQVAQSACHHCTGVLVHTISVPFAYTAVLTVPQTIEHRALHAIERIDSIGTLVHTHTHVDSADEVHAASLKHSGATVEIRAHYL